MMAGELVKKCKTCGELKPLGEFRLNRMMRDGHRSLCKPCSKENDRQYRVANHEKIRKNQRRFRVANPEKVRENDRRWRVANPEKRKENDRRYRIENPEKIKEKNRRFRVANPEKTREYRRLESKKRRSTLKGKLHNAISSAMNRSLKGNKNGRHWETLVGYTRARLHPASSCCRACVGVLDFRFFSHLWRCPSGGKVRGMLMAKDAPRIEKPCRVCGEMMYCTPRREVCSKCRRIIERKWKRMRRLKNGN